AWSAASLSALRLPHPTTALTAPYTLPLHDALPIYQQNGDDHDRTGRRTGRPGRASRTRCPPAITARPLTSRCLTPSDGRFMLRKDRKSTRLNSSHVKISYAVFCLKKKKTYNDRIAH